MTCFCVRPITIFFNYTVAYHIWNMRLSPWIDVSLTFMILIQCWSFIIRSIFFRVFASMCLTRNLCLLWHCHTIFGTLVYHHAQMHKTKRHHSVKTERRHSVTFQSPFSRLNGRHISVTIQWPFSAIQSPFRRLSVIFALLSFRI